MALDFGPVKAGPYTGTWNSVAIGFTIEGYQLATRFLKQMIDRTDLYGNTMIDSIHQGANTTIRYDSRNYDAGNLGPAFPYGGLGIVMSTTKPVGYNDRAHAQALVLTSTANTPAAAAPATLTASKTTLSENFPVEMLFDSTARKIPVQMNLIPYESGSSAGTLIHYSTT